MLRDFATYNELKTTNTVLGKEVYINTQDLLDGIDFDRMYPPNYVTKNKKLARILNEERYNRSNLGAISYTRAFGCLYL